MGGTQRGRLEALADLTPARPVPSPRGGHPRRPMTGCPPERGDEVSVTVHGPLTPDLRLRADTLLSAYAMC